MKAAGLIIFSLLWTVPLSGQGLTIALKETGPTGLVTQPMLQAAGGRARLDIPSMLSQVLYDSETKTLHVVVPLTKSYREYTPAIVKELASAAAAKGEAGPVKITYKRTGSSKVREWPCTAYDGFRGSEKVAEICVADDRTIGVSRADFTIVQQAIDMTKSIAPQDLIERIPIYGSVENQGFAGFPIRRVSFRNGQPDSTTELVEIRRDAVPPASFAVPAGFTKGK